VISQRAASLLLVVVLVVVVLVVVLVVVPVMVCVMVGDENLCGGAATVGSVREWWLCTCLGTLRDIPGVIMKPMKWVCLGLRLR
jgi:hypothetical protein